MKKFILMLSVSILTIVSYAQEQTQPQAKNAEQSEKNSQDSISNKFKFNVTYNAILKTEKVEIGSFKSLTCKVVILTDMSNANKAGFISFEGKHMFGYLTKEDIYPCYDALKLVKNELQPAIYTHYKYESSTGFWFAAELENKNTWYAICVGPESDRQEFKKKELDELMNILEIGYAKIEEMLR